MFCFQERNKVIASCYLPTNQRKLEKETLLYYFVSKNITTYLAFLLLLSLLVVGGVELRTSLELKNLEDEENKQTAM